MSLNNAQLTVYLGLLANNQNPEIDTTIHLTNKVLHSFPISVLKTLSERVEDLFYQKQQELDSLIDDSYIVSDNSYRHGSYLVDDVDYSNDSEVQEVEEELDWLQTLLVNIDETLDIKEESVSFSF